MTLPFFDSDHHDESAIPWMSDRPALQLHASAQRSGISLLSLAEPASLSARTCNVGNSGVLSAVIKGAGTMRMLPNSCMFHGSMSLSTHLVTSTLLSLQFQFQVSLGARLSAGCHLWPSATAVLEVSDYHVVRVLKLEFGGRIQISESKSCCVHVF